jgi:hypothetical protein
MKPVLIFVTMLLVCMATTLRAQEKRKTKASPRHPVTSRILTDQQEGFTFARPVPAEDENPVGLPEEPRVPSVVPGERPTTMMLRDSEVQEKQPVRRGMKALSTPVPLPQEPKPADTKTE